MKRILIALGLFLGFSMGAQEYWLPSGELIERARQESIIRTHIDKYFAKRIVMGGEDSKETWTLKGDELRITHDITMRRRNSYSSGQYVYVETDASYQPDIWTSLAKEEYSALMLNRSEQLYSDYPSLCDPWLTWLFYTAGYMMVDDWKFKRYKKGNEVIVTRPKDLADTAIQFYHLPDWSRESQIALLSRNTSYRTLAPWCLDSDMRYASKYSDIKSMSAEGIEVCVGVLDAAEYESMAGDASKAVAYLHADNPLIVIAARTLGLPLLIHLYDITRLGTKTSLVVNPESL